MRALLEARTPARRLRCEVSFREGYDSSTTPSMSPSLVVASFLVSHFPEIQNSTAMRMMTRNEPNVMTSK